MLWCIAVFMHQGREAREGGARLEGSEPHCPAEEVEEVEEVAVVVVEIIP